MEKSINEKPFARLRVLFIGCLGAWIFSTSLCAEPATPLQLKSFVGQSPVKTAGVDWLLPQGKQVLDGIPFQMDGAVYFYATNADSAATAWTNLNFTISRKFEKLHLLAATDVGGPDGIEVARVHFHYAGGSEKSAVLNYGKQLRVWKAPLHKPEEPLKNPDAHLAWAGQNSSAAQSDKYLRFFHVIVANPDPAREVRSLAFESARTQYGLLLFAATTAPQSPDKLADTISLPSTPFPDLRPRKGEPVQGEGFVVSNSGKPIPHALVRVQAVREFNTEDSTSTRRIPAVGLAAEADDRGHFVLPPLPDDKLYRLLAYADNHDSSPFGGMDPKSGPIKLRLKELSNPTIQQPYAAHGRIIGPDGNPVPFAVIEQEGVDNGFGGSQGFADEVIANKDGEFAMARNQSFNRVRVKISAPALATTNLWMDASNGVQEIRMDVGAQLRGRVLKDGKPLTNVLVGVVGSERRSELFVGFFEEWTDANGEFVFEHLPANTQWYFYGKMSSIKPYGALPPRPVSTGNSGQTNDLGELSVIPAIHLAGRVKALNGEPLPAGLKMYVGYEAGWDTQTAIVEKDGQFRFDGLSARTVTVSVQSQSWRLASDNRSLDRLNPFRLIGQLQSNKDDLLLVIEKRPMRFNYYNTGNGSLPTGDEANSRPLYGAEEGGPGYIVLAGSVLDDQTGKPITNCIVTPGYKPPKTSIGMPPKPLLKKVLEPLAKKNAVPFNEQIYWEYNAQDTNVNSVFSVRFLTLRSLPVLRVEAPGYEPLETDPANATTTNLVLRLKKGIGPNGIILLPDGKPANAASIIYAANREQYQLSGTSLNTARADAWRVTGADGKFSFDTRAEGNMLFVSHPSGWAQFPLADYTGQDLSITLKPWASVKGTLVDSNNVPMPTVSLRLTMFHDWQQGGALVNLNHEAVTDAQGNFVFNNVPPARVEVQRLAPFGPGLSYQLQSWLFVEPGQINDLGKVTYDKPPPPPPMERLKQSLGL